MNNANWQARTQIWLESCKKYINNETKPFVIEFFTYVLLAVPERHHDKFWFGTNNSAVNIVIGGIALATIAKSGSDKGVWLLVSQEIQVPHAQCKRCKLTNHLPNPLYWLHFTDVNKMTHFLETEEIWEYVYDAALRLPDIKRAANRYTDQQRREQHKVTVAECLNSPTDTFPSSQPSDILTVNAIKQRYANITYRVGQKAFRIHALDKFQHTCVITGCKVSEVLEAAHITPLHITKNHEENNCLLLRADIHKLFDIEQITINATTFNIQVSSQLFNTEYQQLAGQTAQTISTFDFGEHLLNHNKRFCYKNPKNRD